MIKNKLIALGTLALFSGAITAAQDEWSVTTSFTYESSYMFRGMKFADNTFFPSVDVAYGAFYGGIWAAFPVDTDTDNEVDFYVGYGLELNEMVSLDLGVTYYTFPSSTDKFFASDNTVEFYAGLAFDLPYSPAIYVYYDIDLEDLTLEASAGHSIEIAENLTFDVSGAFGGVFVDGGKDYIYGVGTAGFGYAINQAASISVFASHSRASVDYNFTRGSKVDISKHETWFGVSVTAGF